MRYKFISSPIHDPNITAHLPASILTDQSPYKCLGPYCSHSYLHTSLKHINTSGALCTCKPYRAHIHTVFSLHMCSHMNTVPYLFASSLSPSFVILNINLQACFWPFTFWHWFLSPLEFEHGLSLRIITCLLMRSATQIWNNHVLAHTSKESKFWHLPFGQRHNLTNSSGPVLAAPLLPPPPFSQRCKGRGGGCIWPGKTVPQIIRA